MKPIGRFVRAVVRLLAGVMLLGMVIWGALAVYYSDLASAGFRTALSSTFILGTVIGLLFVRPRRRAVVGFFIVFAGIVMWWLAIPPSNDRDWQPDVAVLPYASTAARPISRRGITTKPCNSLNYRPWICSSPIGDRR
jgi:hypothetical protein